MPLRCLLFSSHEELVEPIWQVLGDLGIEGEYCRSAVDAVEKVTTQPFQIVITDWDDQPEAAFLLKTARDLKATQRPLTLAIVSDDARPEALRAGANSVLVKPIRPEQVRDTMSTACQLLQAKHQQPAQQSGAATSPRPAPTASVMAAATAAARAPVAQAPEKTLRVDAIPKAAASAPDTRSDREFEVEPAGGTAGPEALPKSDIPTQEPTATAADASEAQPSKPKEVLTGWAMLQARLNAPVFGTGKAPSANPELLSYGETPSQAAPRAQSPAEEVKSAAKPESKPEDEPEAALFAYMTRRGDEQLTPDPVAKRGRGKLLLFAALVVVAISLAVVPRTQQGLVALYRNTVRAGNRWLNPPPPPLPQAAPQHDSFGQSGDEYKLPVVGNIPDATTDPSQIQVLPVVDPTAKPEKGTGASVGQTPGTTTESNSPTDQTQTPPFQPPMETATSTTGVKDPATSAGIVPQNSASGAADPFLPQNPARPAQVIVPQLPSTPPARISSPTHAPSAGSNVGIPSSLRSQLAATTPESSGAKPVEAAMSSIEPVNLPESAARQLLTQPLDPEYPAAAKASGQRGSVVLQVLIGRDGAVQDAKFIQGSFVFARAAIDAVKQWHFKPYSMNGRAVAVQSTITLTFKPPA